MVGLGEITDVVQAPAEKAPAPIVMPGAKCELSQLTEQCDPPKGVSPQQRGLCGPCQLVEVIKPHVKRRLGAVIKIGVPEGLDTKTIAQAEVGTVIL